MLRSSRALVLAQAAPSLPRRPFRAPLARRPLRIPSELKDSLESQQAMSPELHWSLAWPMAAELVKAMLVFSAAGATAATDMAKARIAVKLVICILMDWKFEFGLI